MPVAQFPGRATGATTASTLRRAEQLRRPRGLQRLVDAATARAWRCSSTWSTTTSGPRATILPRFGPYFTDRYRTPWGALNFDGPDSDEVRDYFIASARRWLEEFHLDGLRLDAVHAINDRGAAIPGRDGRSRPRPRGRLGRLAVLVAESDLNDPR